ncbi:hypothetical protein D3C72_716760 [compost metagenome]
MQHQRIARARAGIDLAGRRKSQTGRAGHGQVRGREGVASQQYRTRHRGVGIVAALAQRHAAHDGARVDETVARARRARRLEPDTARDHALIDEVHLAAAVRGNHRQIRQTHVDVGAGGALDHAGIAEVADPADTVLHRQRQAGRRRRQGGRRFHHAAQRARRHVRDADRAGRGVAHHQPRR